MSRSTTSQKSRSFGPLALLAAVVLLVVAMAGSATAAALITGKDVKNGSLTGKDVKANSLKSKQVRNGTLTGADVKDGGLTGIDVQDGSVAEGDLAPAVRGKLNAPSLSGYEVVTDSVTIESDGEDWAAAACTAGKIAVGGGGSFEDSNITTTSIEGSRPQKVIRGDSLLFTDADPGFADGWRVDGKHSSNEPQDLTAYVVCVDPS